MHKPLLITLGLLFAGLAMLGIFLPMLPTTPLLLVAVACFARSSDKLHERIVTHKTFGPLIRQWNETRSMPRKAKFYALVSIGITGVISISSVQSDDLKLLVTALLAIPVVIIIRIKTGVTN
jgi:uncharacterized membrane protein YbaN (DUF454 family)